jgi:hypothetical protein
MLLQVTMLAAISTIIFILKRELLPPILVGVIFAFVIGFILQEWGFNARIACALYRTIAARIRIALESAKETFEKLRTKLEELEGSTTDATFPRQWVTKPTIFISYSHKDDNEKNDLVHCKVNIDKIIMVSIMSPKIEGEHYDSQNIPREAHQKAKERIKETDPQRRDFSAKT